MSSSRLFTLIIRIFYVSVIPGDIELCIEAQYLRESLRIPWDIVLFVGYFEIHGSRRFGHRKAHGSFKYHARRAETRQRYDDGRQDARIQSKNDFECIKMLSMCNVLTRPQGRLTAQGKLLLQQTFSVRTEDSDSGSFGVSKERKVFLFEQVVIFAELVDKKIEDRGFTYKNR